MSNLVLITGGAGFIGSHLCDELLDRGYRVRVIDSLVPQVHGPTRERPEYLSPDVELITADVRDRDALRRALTGVDSVVHLVAAVGVGQSMYEIEHYTSTNCLGTAVLLELLAEHPVRRLLVASSMSIYGEGAYRGRGGVIVEPPERAREQCEQGLWEVLGTDATALQPIPTPETKQPRPSSVYALSKYDQERLGLLVGGAYGVSTTALRFFNVFGPRQALANPYTGVLAIFSASYLSGTAPRIFEDGRQMRDFVNVHDVARACRLALESDAASGEVLNVGSGRPVTIAEVAVRMARTLERTDIEPVVTNEYRVGDIRHCFADISKARRLLGYEPAIGFDDGLRELAAWLQETSFQPGSASAGAREELSRRGLVLAGRASRVARRRVPRAVVTTPAAGDASCDPARAPAVPVASGAAQPESGDRRGSSTIRDGGPAADRACSDERSRLGLVEWFRIDDGKKVERVLGDLERLGIGMLRTGISWADYHRPEGKAWYDWLLPRLAARARLLPCIMYTPPSLGVAARTSSPPRDTKHLGDFVDVVLTEYGRHFDTIELWNEPTNPNHWDRSLDPDWSRFCDMIGKAAHWAKHRDMQTVLGGVGPADFDWFRVVAEQGALRFIDVLGVHARPGTWEQDTDDFPSQLGALGAQLDQLGLRRRLWITEAAYSTWQRDEHRQLQQFLRLVACPVERVYWSSIEDDDPEAAFADGWKQDERHFHFGLKRLNGSPKLLYRLLSNGGVPAASRFLRLAWSERETPAAPPPRSGGKRRLRPVAARSRPVLVFGGAGFIGTNLCARLLDEGREVTIFDNLSRPGVEQNLEWLQERGGGRVHVVVEDVRDARAVRRAVEKAPAVFHLAAQVAVTTSLADPAEDFSVNAAGTLNVLEACRRQASPPPLLYTSTNKVYGALDDLPLTVDGDRYVPSDQTVRRYGVDERRPLDFHSPYGCSKGVADQYVLDYARCYGVPTVVLRMSCIYGPHQWGTEDQGWIAHFVRQALADRPIAIYGDGFQVRDALFVEDLVDAMLRAVAALSTAPPAAAVSGRAFNVGGGPAHTVSPAQVIERLAALLGRTPRVVHGPWRQGDQRYYVSDTRAFANSCGWAPRVTPSEGIERLAQWLGEQDIAEPAAEVRLPAASTAAKPGRFVP